MYTRKKPWKQRGFPRGGAVEKPVETVKNS